MAKRIENKYLYFILKQSMALGCAIATIITCLYFFISQYMDFFNSDKPEVFWIGFLLVVLLIISSAILIISSALIVKNLFYINRGYEFDKDENRIVAKKEVKND